MSGDFVIANARIVTADEVVTGSLAVRKGEIGSIDPGRTAVPEAIDLEGDLLLPGLIEIHTDNLERHYMPRPGVLWPSTLAAVLAHDTQIAGAGITTVYDAIAVGEYASGSARRKMLARSVSTLERAIARRLLRADHRLHLRCEVSDQAVVEMFEPYAQDPLVRLVSIMDHTPGQRQWYDLEKYRQFNRDRKWTDEEFEAHLARRQELQQRFAIPHRRQVLDLWAPRGLPLASHDDTTEAHVEEGLRDGISISEFPTTLAAARKAKALGMRTIMGAPNVVRGESHSGNISALELAAEGLLDGLSSDYVPSSLLHGAFVIHERLETPLPDAVALVSLNVARMLGLEDRGEIAPGKRADLLRVHPDHEVPVVRSVWREGSRIA